MEAVPANPQMKPGRNSNLVDYLDTPAAATAQVVMTARSDAYLASTHEHFRERDPRQLAGELRQRVQRTDVWRDTQCLNMNAAESTTSRLTRALLDSDLATRVTEGFPGDKEFPPSVQNEDIDEIEALLIHLARRLFGAAYVEWRPVSTTMAFLTTFLATTKPGDTILVQSMEGGGSMTYSLDGPPGWLGLKVVEIPPAGHFESDLEAARALAMTHRPRLIIVGGSYILFEPALAELRSIADKCGALLVYDAAHVSLYGATGCAPHPLQSGVDIMLTSTHKILGGPVGGLVMTQRADLARKILQVPFPGLLQTRDQNKLAATAHALSEMVEHGANYARQTVVNARALATALQSHHFDVFAADRGVTNTHQLFLNVAQRGAREVERQCQAANLLLHAAHMAGDSARGCRTGIRITVQELTRRGMMASDMTEVASLIAAATDLRDQREPDALRARVADLSARFPHVRYSFDE
jgi:glycine hydroxymethyltransferase